MHRRGYMGFPMEDDYMSMDGQMGWYLSVQDEVAFTWPGISPSATLSFQMLNNFDILTFSIM